jgi:hypothetical protein
VSLNRASEPQDDLARFLSYLDCGPHISSETLDELVRHVSSVYGASLPEDYVAFLRRANGADGTLANGAPVVLWSAELLARVNADFEHRMPGFLIIGSDTGDYVYGIDLRPDAPAERYVETEDVSMDWDYILWRGRSLRDLLAHVDPPRLAASAGPGDPGDVPTRHPPSGDDAAMSADNAWHSHREPDGAMRRFVEGATFVTAPDGMSTAIEVTVFSGGEIYVTSSRIVPDSGKRTIVADTALMFGDMDEVKDAVDQILDRLSVEAEGR